MPRFHIAVIAVIAVVVLGCSADSGSGESAAPSSPAGQRFPDVIDVSVEATNDTFAFEVTISSPYDTPERYADGWRIVGPDDTVYGEHELTHDHADEQPFTRRQGGVKIPEGVDEVTVEGRDSEHGYGGATITVPLPGR